MIKSTYVTSLSRVLASYSYAIESFIQRLPRITYSSHCGSSFDDDYGGHCGGSSSRITNHCGQSIDDWYGGHCGSSSHRGTVTNHCGAPVDNHYGGHY